MPYAGIDIADFPGLTALQEVKSNSTLEFLGYYMEAVCHNRSDFKPFEGNFAALVAMGWKMLVIWVGRQDNGGACQSTHLTAPVGRADATETGKGAENDGIPHGGRIFLDVERVDQVSTRLLDYYNGWIYQILDEGKYVPAVYCHVHNADVLWPAAVSAFRAHARADMPVFWLVGGPANFSLASNPTDCGFANASIWQGPTVNRTYGSVTLSVDENVSSIQNPLGV
jgi:hypothetical protein